MGHREGLARTGYTQKHLTAEAIPDPLAQLFNGPWLVAFGRKGRDQFKGGHMKTSSKLKAESSKQNTKKNCPVLAFSFELSPFSFLT
jgi:hypothetical protein